MNRIMYMVFWLLIILKDWIGKINNIWIFYGNKWIWYLFLNKEKSLFKMVYGVKCKVKIMEFEEEIKNLFCFKGWEIFLRI